MVLCSCHSRLLSPRAGSWDVKHAHLRRQPKKILGKPMAWWLISQWKSGPCLVHMSVLETMPALQQAQQGGGLDCQVPSVGPWAVRAHTNRLKNSWAQLRQSIQVF